MRVKLYFPVLLITLLSSCTYMIKSFEKDPLEEKNVTPLSKTKQTYCEIIQKSILISENKATILSFQKFMSKITKSRNLRYVEKVALWILTQVNARPDLHAPSAKIQFFIKAGSENVFINSYTEDSKGFPVFHAIETLLKRYRSKISLRQLAGLYDRHFPNELIVSEELAQFLTKNQGKIKRNAILSNYYIRGDEPLKTGETLPKIKLTPLVKRYNRGSKKNYVTNNFLFDSKEKGLNSRCNFEMSLYKNSIFLINQKPIQSHTYGYKRNDQIFMATATQQLDGIVPLEKTLLFAGKSNIRSSAMCHFFNQSLQKQMWFISASSRDPGQHIYHLLEYGLEDVKDIKSLDTMMKFSRHQFLKNPIRLIIESRRSSEKQINELLKLNIPIYNAKKLGKVWAFYQDAKNQSFVLDDRRSGHLECTSQ